jgi:hypothetical protein
MRGPRRGLVASDVVDGLPAALDELEPAGGRGPGPDGGGLGPAGVD